ncbi:MAG: Gfo/Idh/MocA family protein [Limisphaerales bacterium]
MNKNSPKTPSGSMTRRDFLRNSSLMAGAAAISAPSILNAQSKQPLNAVIVGVGGRGGGAGANFLEAAKIAGAEAKIVAVADVSARQASRGRQEFGVPENKCFSGFDSYIKAMEEPGVNYVILATPPGFRQVHFRKAVQLGKHIFTEKPVCVDAPGARLMYAAGEEALKKNLKVAAGTQRRHGDNYVETIKRIHDGAIGDITALRAYWVNGGPIWHRGENGSTPLEVQVNNWYHYIWLCGDHIVEQHVHNLDVANWVKGEHPVKAWGMGARQMLGNKPGEIWDNFAVEFEYSDGVRCSSYCGQVKRSWASVSEAVVGSKGTADPGGSIRPKEGQAWRYRGQKISDYVQEHVDLINAIHNDTPLNEAKNVTDSTFTAVLGREAAYSGNGVGWDELLQSNFRYGPDALYDENPDAAAKMKFGDFRTLTPPLPGTHNILADPPVV